MFRKSLLTVFVWVISVGAFLTAVRFIYYIGLTFGNGAGHFQHFYIGLIMICGFFFSIAVLGFGFYSIYYVISCAISHLTEEEVLNIVSDCCDSKVIEKKSGFLSVYYECENCNTECELKFKID